MKESRKTSEEGRDLQKQEAPALSTFQGCSGNRAPAVLWTLTASDGCRGWTAELWSMRFSQAPRCFTSIEHSKNEASKYLLKSILTFTSHLHIGLSILCISRKVTFGCVCTFHCIYISVGVSLLFTFKTHSSVLCACPLENTKQQGT